MQLHVYHIVYQKFCNLYAYQLSMCSLFSLYKDTEEKIERGNHASLQDVAVIVCVHQEKTMESIAQLA